VNTETLIVQYLSRRLGVPVSTDVPPERPARFVTVERTGGTETRFASRPMPAVRGTISTLLNVAGQILPVLSPLIPALIVPLADAISLLIPPITNIITSLLPPIMDLIEQLVPPVSRIIGVIAYVAGVLASTLIPIIARIVPVINVVVETVSGLLNSLTPVIVSIVSSVAGMCTSDDQLDVISCDYYGGFNVRFNVHTGGLHRINWCIIDWSNTPDAIR